MYVEYLDSRKTVYKIERETTCERKLDSVL